MIVLDFKKICEIIDQANDPDKRRASLFTGDDLDDDLDDFEIEILDPSFFADPERMAAFLKAHF